MTTSSLIFSNQFPLNAFGRQKGMLNSRSPGHHSGSLYSSKVGICIYPREHCTMKGMNFSNWVSVILSREVGYPPANNNGRLETIFLQFPLSISVTVCGIVTNKVFQPLSLNYCRFYFAEFKSPNSQKFLDFNILQLIYVFTYWSAHPRIITSVRITSNNSFSLL